MSYTRKINIGGKPPHKKSTFKKNLPSKNQENTVLINEMISKIEENLTDNNYISISIVECKEPTGVNYKVFKIDKNTYDGNINKPTSDLNPSNLQTAIDEFKKNNGFTKAHQDAKYAYFRINLFFYENAIIKFNIEGIPIFQKDTYNYCPIGDSIFTEYSETQKTNITDDERIADEFMTELNEEEKTRLTEQARIATEKAAAEEAEKVRLAAVEAEKVRLAAVEAEKVRLAEEARIAAEEAEKVRLAAVEAEKARLAEEARIAAEEAEKVRLAAEEAEKVRLAAVEAERVRLAEEAEKARLAEEARIAEKARLAEEARIAAEEAEKVRLAAEEAEKVRLAAVEAERVRLAEEARIAAEEAEKARLAEEARIATEKAAAEEAERVRLAEEAERVRLAEEARVAEAKAADEKAAMEDRLDIIVDNKKLDVKDKKNAVLQQLFNEIDIIVDNDSLDVEDKKLAVLLHLFNEILKNPQVSNNLKDEVQFLMLLFDKYFGEGKKYGKEKNSKNLQNIFECILVNWPDNKDEQITRIKEERDIVKIIQVMKKIDNTNTYPNPKDMNEIIATLEDIDTIPDDEYDNIFKHMDSLSQEQTIENKKGHLLQVTSILQSHINRINPCMNNSVEEPVEESVDEQVDAVTDTWKDVEGPDTESIDDDTDTLKEVDGPDTESFEEPVKNPDKNSVDVEDEDTRKEVETKQGILDMIDEISNIVTNREYRDNTKLTVELTENMQSLKGFVDELHKLSSYLTPKKEEIDSSLGKQNCNVALNYINDNNTADVYNDHLDDDFTKVNIAYTTYINYRTALFTDNFEEHKQKLISELANFKKNLIKNVYSMFKYGESEYCKDKRILDDELIQSVEKANQQAERVLSRADSMSRPSEDKSTTMLRSNSEPLIQMNKSTKPYTKAEINIITNGIIRRIDSASEFPTHGKDIFIRNITMLINELLKDPDVKEEKRLRDIELHLTKYLQEHSSSPEEITRYLSRVKNLINKTYGGKTRKHKIKSNTTKKYKRVSKEQQANKNKSIRTKTTKNKRQTRKRK